MDVDDMIDVIFQCKACSTQTSTKEDLRNHIKEAHNSKKENIAKPVVSVNVVCEEETLTTSSASDNATTSANDDDITLLQSTVKVKPRYSKRGRKLSQKVTNKDFEFYPVSKKPKLSKKIVGAVVNNVEPVHQIHISKEILPKPSQKYKKDTTKRAKNKATPTKRNVCPNCRSRFISEEELEMHINSHYMDIFKCVMCDYTNVNWYRIKIHMQIHNKPDTHECDKCNQSFSSQYSLYNHKRFSHLGGTRLCEDCGFQAASKYQLVQHRMKNHVMNLSCSECGFICDNQLDMAEHIKLRHESGYICKLCKSNTEARTYPTKADLQEHLDRDHDGRKCFFCDKCNYVAKLRHHLEKHKHMHTGTRPYACKYEGCLFRTRDHRNLRQHMLMKHRKPGDMVCRQCQFVTTIQNEWDVHQAMFHMTVFECEQCSYTSRSKAAIRRHRLAKHTSQDKMRYPCLYCSYKSNLKECLQKHLLTHDTKNKDFKCPFCSINLPGRRLMEDHLESNHVGEEAFFCDLCSYVTKTPVLLKQHFQTHNKEKPFSCTKCSYSGRTKNLLQSHMMHKHHVSSRDLTGGGRHSVGEAGRMSDVNKSNVTSSTSVATSSNATKLQTDDAFAKGSSDTSKFVLLPEDVRSLTTTTNNITETKTTKAKPMSSAKLSKKIQMEMRRISGDPSSAAKNITATVRKVDSLNTIKSIVASNNSHLPPSYVLLPTQHGSLNLFHPEMNVPYVPSLPNQTVEEYSKEEDSRQLTSLSNYDPRAAPDTLLLEDHPQSDCTDSLLLDLDSSSLQVVAANQEVPILIPLSPASVLQQ